MVPILMISYEKRITRISNAVPSVLFLFFGKCTKKLINPKSTHSCGIKYDKERENTERKRGICWSLVQMISISSSGSDCNNCNAIALPGSVSVCVCVWL